MKNLFWNIFSILMVNFLRLMAKNSIRHYFWFFYNYTLCWKKKILSMCTCAHVQFGFVKKYVKNCFVFVCTAVKKTSQCALVTTGPPAIRSMFIWIHPGTWLKNDLLRTFYWKIKRLLNYIICNHFSCKIIIIFVITLCLTNCKY